MPKTPMFNTPLPFDELVEAIKGRRSIYGYISGLRFDRVAPGEAWSSLRTAQSSSATPRRVFFTAAS